MPFARFMSGRAGRALRIIAGLALVVVGVLIAALLGTVGAVVGGVIVAVVGAAVFVAGVANVCLIAPILRAPFRGRDARS